MRTGAQAPERSLEPLVLRALCRGGAAKRDGG